MSEHWEAAVEAALQSFDSNYDEPWTHTPWLRRQIENELTAALPHLRSMVVAELLGKAEEEAERRGEMVARTFGGSPFPNLTDAAGAARWLAAQEEA